MEKERRIHKLIKLDEKLPVDQREIHLSNCTVTFELLTTADWQNLRMAVRMLNGIFQQRHAMRDLRQAVEETVNSLNVQFKESSIQLETEFTTPLFKKPKLTINVVVTDGGAGPSAPSIGPSTVNPMASVVSKKAFNASSAVNGSGGKDCTLRTNSGSSYGSVGGSGGGTGGATGDLRTSTSLTAGTSSPNPHRIDTQLVRCSSNGQQQSQQASINNAGRVNSGLMPTISSAGEFDSNSLGRNSDGGSCSGGGDSGGGAADRSNSGSLRRVGAGVSDANHPKPNSAKDEEIRALREKQERTEIELQRVQAQFATFSHMQSRNYGGGVGSSGQSIQGAPNRDQPQPQTHQSPTASSGQPRTSDVHTASRTSSNNGGVTIKFNDDMSMNESTIHEDSSPSISGVQSGIASTGRAGPMPTGRASGGDLVFGGSVYYMNDHAAGYASDQTGVDHRDANAHVSINRALTSPLEGSVPAPRPRPRPRPGPGGNDSMDRQSSSPGMDRSRSNTLSDAHSQFVMNVKRSDSSLSSASEQFDNVIPESSPNNCSHQQIQGVSQNFTNHLAPRTPPLNSHSQHQRPTSQKANSYSPQTQTQTRNGGSGGSVAGHDRGHSTFSTSSYTPGRTSSQIQTKERRVVMDGATVTECSFFHELLEMTKQERHDKLCELFAGRKNGDWLLRYNSEQNSYIITLKFLGTLLHIKIPQDETGTFELGEVAFSRLVDLLSYYSNHRLSEDIPIRLNECVRVQLPELQGDAGYVVIGPKQSY
eukprot:CFRG0729T1